MRVRYEMAGDSSYTAECDLTEKQARKRFEELVGEDDDNYMEVLEDFDQTKLANIMKSIIG